MISPIGELAWLFFRLGATCFGGPAVYIAMMEDECVRRRQWLSREYFLDLLGATNLIPGPNALEMACHIGYCRAGFGGSIVAGAAFMFPAAVISGLLAWGYLAFGTLMEVQPYLEGIKPVVLGLLFAALGRLGRTALRGWQAGLIAAGVAAAAIAGCDEVLTLLAGAIAGALIISFTRRPPDRPPAEPSPPEPMPPAAAQPPGPAKTAGVLCGAAALSPARAHAAATAAVTATVGAGAVAIPFSLLKLGLFFLKIGAVLYGTGYVLVAYLQGGLVHDYGWLSEQQLLDAVAAGQMTPGPLISTATFIGYLLGGVPGALVATLGICLPSFVFVAIVNRWVARVRQWRWTSILLDAVNAASLGLMGAVCYTLAVAGVTHRIGWVLAVAAAVVSLRFKIAPAWLVLAGALIGRLLLT